MLFVFFIHTAATEIYTLSLHDALPILLELAELVAHRLVGGNVLGAVDFLGDGADLFQERHLVRIEQFQLRSEEHTSELQSLTNLVCRLLLEKKKKPIQGTPNLHVEHAK